MLDLLPCPWCGHEPYDDTETSAIMGARTGSAHAIACSHCEASAPGADSWGLAAETWNRRAPAKDGL